MFLENVVMDAVDPQRLGRFWEAALGCERLTDEPEGFETRLTVEGGPVLDLCFQRVAAPEPRSARAESAPAPESSRLYLEIVGRSGQTQEVERLLGLGARHLDLGRIHQPGVVLADPQGNPCYVLAEAAAYPDAGPLAVLALDCADPDRDAHFWSWLTGWTDVDGVEPRSLDHPSRNHPSLRHASQRGPVLELRPEHTAKGTTKNPLHLDVRLETADDADEVAAGIAERGGRELHPAWGELPWRVYTDPSGNEFCVLPSPS